jgi:hypothetical protein
MFGNKLTIAFHALPIKYEFIPQMSVIQWENNSASEPVDCQALESFRN